MTDTKDIYLMMAARIKNDPVATEMAVGLMNDDVKRAEEYIKFMVGEEPTSEIVQLLLAFLISKPEHILRVENTQHLSNALGVFVGLGVIYQRCKQKEVM